MPPDSQEGPASARSGVKDFLCCSHLLTSGTSKIKPPGTRSTATTNRAMRMKFMMRLWHARLRPTVTMITFA